MELFLKILAGVAIAAIPVLTGFLCDFLHKLADEALQSTEDKRVKAIINEIDSAVGNAVRYVNQTFVDALKKANEWNEDNAKLAFKTAYETTIEIVSSDALEYIADTFGDVRKYIEVKIEDRVNYEKIVL